MSKFTALPTDNSKTGASADSIFYRPQSTLSDQYKNERIEQQRKQQALLSNVNAPHRSRPKLQPVARIALGGGGSRNRNANRTTTTLLANKPANQTEALRAYKRKYSRKSFEAFDTSKLPKGTDVCSLFHRPLHYNRAYAAHFVGSKGPKFSRAKLECIREPDLQTKLEQIQYDKSLNAKRRDELIAKLKFGLEDDEERVSTHHTGLDRPHWFRFEPKSDVVVDDAASAAANTSTSKHKNHSSDRPATGTGKEQQGRGAWLGKPKQEDKNYCYVVMEWQPDSKQGWVYPAKFMEFGLATQLKSDADTSAESVERRHRKHLEKWRKKQAEKSMMEKLTNMFGHDDDKKKKQAKTRSSSEMELDAGAKEQLKAEYMDTAEIDDEEIQMLRDLLGVDVFKQFAAEHREVHADNKNGEALRTGDEDSLIADKVLSKRLLANKCRGALDENCDHDEFMSDDEDENNLNDYDVVDNHEEDVMSDLDGGDNDSDKDEAFQKLEKNLDEDLTKKDYELPEQALKDELDDSDVEEQGDMWNISDDESDADGGGGAHDDDDDDDGSGGVTIKRKHKTGGKKEDSSEKQSAEQQQQQQQPTSRKRKAQFDDKNGQKNKRRKLSESEEKKLRDELIELVSKILKKNPDGIDVQTLWNKIVATVSADKDTVRQLLPSVIKKTAKTKSGSKMLVPKND